MANVPEQIGSYQLLILGAGPAGCAAAITAALAGMKVAIVERSNFPRDRPGEAIHPGMRPLFVQLGVEKEIEKCNFTTFEGVWREFEGMRTFSSFGPVGDPNWLGLQAVRSKFDSVLLSRAVQLGVDIFQPVKALRPIKSSKHQIIGIETSRGSIFSRFTIDACGGNHWLARQLEHKIRTYSPTLIAHYGYEKSCPVSDSQLPIMSSETNGWTWRAKISKNCYQWVKMSWATLLKEKRKERNSLAANVTWRCAEKIAGPGFFHVGDAAVVLDPASSHGVLRAVMTGIMSAHVASEIYNAPSQEELLLKNYCEWVSDWFVHDVDHLSKLYSIHLPHPWRKLL